MKTPVTGGACCLPAALGHVGLGTAGWLSADRETHAPPRLVMPMAGTDQRMSDLMQQRVMDRLRSIARDKIDRQLNRLAVKDTQAERAFAPIEREGPGLQPEGVEQRARELLDGEEARIGLIEGQS